MLKLPREMQGNPPASESSIREAERRVGAVFPEDYEGFLLAADGASTPDGVLLYGTPDVGERNDTFEVRKHLPTYIAIGDDSGGRLFLVKAGQGRSSAVFIVDQGGLLEANVRKLPRKLAPWIRAGCPILDEDDDGDEGIAPCVDVWLERMPAGGLKDLMFVRKELRLEIGVAALRDMAERAPVPLLEGVPCEPYRYRCHDINAQAPCVGIRRGGRKLPL